AVARPPDCATLVDVPELAARCLRRLVHGATFLPRPALTAFVACAHVFASTSTQAATFFTPNLAAPRFDTRPSAVTRSSTSRSVLGFLSTAMRMTLGDFLRDFAFVFIPNPPRSGMTLHREALCAAEPE